MAQIGIREYDAKKMLAKWLSKYSNWNINCSNCLALKTPENTFEQILKDNKWLKDFKLVVKPDQLFGKRWKHGLIWLNLDYNWVKEWIKQKSKSEVKIWNLKWQLTEFIIEPLIVHDEEYYLSIQSNRDWETIYFSTEWWVDIEENWEKVLSIPIWTLDNIDDMKLDFKIWKNKNKQIIEDFIKAVYKMYIDYNFSFLEINPFTIKDDDIIALDVVWKLDNTWSFESSNLWWNIDFPVSFGKSFSKEEQFIQKLDEKSGSSLKLTVLNPKWKIWTMVAWWWASVIYADTISDLWFWKEMANYWEYSWNPSTEETKQYASTILDLMTRWKSSSKSLIIWGGIANFTDVAKTFTWIIQALNEYKDKIKKNNIKIYVRRWWPNYKEWLKNIKKAWNDLWIFIDVYGPETHMTEIVKLAINSL